MPPELEQAADDLYWAQKFNWTPDQVDEQSIVRLWWLRRAAGEFDAAMAEKADNPPPKQQLIVPGSGRR